MSIRPSTLPASGLQLRSLITPEGVLELSLADIPVQAPGDGEVLVRVQAAPINPGDLGLLLGPADLATLKIEGSKTTANVPAALLTGVG